MVGGIRHVVEDTFEPKPFLPYNRDYENVVYTESVRFVNIKIVASCPKILTKSAFWASAERFRKGFLRPEIFVVLR
jgi:hypothetical protein